MYTAGEVINGVVDGIAGYGAFVVLPDGRTGLLHVSKITDQWVDSVSDWLTEGDEVEIKGLSDQGEKINLALENGTQKTRRQRFEQQMERYLEESQKSRKELNRQQKGRLHEA